MLEVRKELCLGCGLCALNCPTGAITFPWGRAEINQGRCISCYQCVQVCLGGAIQEKVFVPVGDLRTLVEDLHREAREIIARIEKLREKGGNEYG